MSGIFIRRKCDISILGNCLVEIFYCRDISFSGYFNWDNSTGIFLTRKFRPTPVNYMKCMDPNINRQWGTFCVMRARRHDCNVLSTRRRDIENLIKIDFHSVSSFNLTINFNVRFILFTNSSPFV